MSDVVLRRFVSRLKTVCVLCGGIVRVQPGHKIQTAGWRSSRGTEPDKTGPMPAYERLEAAAALYRLHPDLIFYLAGGQLATDQPWITDVMWEEMVSLGVPETALRRMGGRDTQEQLRLFAAEAREHYWSVDDVSILSNLLHAGRIMSMLLSEPRELVYPLLDPGSRTLIVRPIAAERVLIDTDPAHWSPYFQWIYRDPAMLAVTLASETLGIGHLLTGCSLFRDGPYRGFGDPLQTE